jgi:hypothetical protein
MNAHSALLGMSVNKAVHRLRKSVFFSLVVALGRDVCLRCGERIVEAESLSLDHIEPWRYVSADLFWSIKNIAFSHRACNKTDRPGRKRRVVPKGMAWCGACRAALPTAKFTEFGIKSRVCKDCRARKNRKRYLPWRKSRKYKAFTRRS